MISTWSPRTTTVARRASVGAVGLTRAATRAGAFWVSCWMVASRWATTSLRSSCSARSRRFQAPRAANRMSAAAAAAIRVHRRAGRANGTTVSSPSSGAACRPRSVVRGRSAVRSAPSGASPARSSRVDAGGVGRVRAAGVVDGGGRRRARPGAPGRRRVRSAAGGPARPARRRRNPARPARRRRSLAPAARGRRSPARPARGRRNPAPARGRRNPAPSSGGGARCARLGGGGRCVRLGTWRDVLGAGRRTGPPPGEPVGVRGVDPAGQRPLPVAGGGRRRRPRRQHRGTGLGHRRPRSPRLGPDRGHDPLPQRRRRRLVRQRVRQVGDRVQRLPHRRRAPVAAGQVHGEAGLVVGVQGGQRPADGERVPVAVPAVARAGRRGGGGGHGRAPSVSETPSSRSRSRRMPASMRVFTVPSGVLVRSAISRWV